jgi:hypothetical protein
VVNEMHQCNAAHNVVWRLGEEGQKQVMKEESGLVKQLKLEKAVGKGGERIT